MMKKLVSLSLLLLAAATSAFAQKAINQSVCVTEVDNVVLPAQVSNLFWLDGHLCISAGGMVFSARCQGANTADAVIDTFLLSVDPEINYAVRQPHTGQLFYTKNDSKGKTFLYEYYEKKENKWASRRVKPSKFSFTIENPVFSPDGQIMVFASDCPLGAGGRDLWYSIFANGEWQYPKNFGDNINTDGDDFNPSMCGDYLVFASNRGLYGGYDLYATRLLAKEQSGDTVSMFPVGLSRSICLHAPFCTGGNDVALTLNESGNEGWFVTSGSEGNVLSHFSGSLHSVMLSGVISNMNGKPVSGAIVTVSHGDSYEVTVPCDRSGRYFLFLQPGLHYDLLFEAPNYFSASCHLTATIKSDEMLYDQASYNISLDAIPVDSLLSFSDMFSSDMGSELSPMGRSRLDHMARFLVENPGLHLTVVSSFGSNPDSSFCALMNQARLRSISDYVVSKDVALDDLILTSETASNTVYFLFSR